MRKVDANIRYVNSFLSEIRYIINQRSPFSYLMSRVVWNFYPRIRAVSRFPGHVDIETSSVCQLRCPMCFQNRDDIKTGIMDFSLFEKIMTEIKKENPYSIRLSWRGECLVNPNFVEMLVHCRSVYKGNISFLTNGLKLSEEILKVLVREKIDYIVISADGIEQTYNEVRKPARFKELIEKLTLLKQMKLKHNTPYPMVRINAVSTWFKDNEMEEFKRTFASLADRILIGNIQNSFKELPVKHDPSRTCASPWQRLLVAHDGNVYPCCEDYLCLYPMGNVNESSLYDIWHGDKATEIRGIMKKHKRLSLKLCREIDCPVDENSYDDSVEFLSLLRRQVNKDNRALLDYIDKA